MNRLDIAFAVIRHITVAGNASFLEELATAIRTEATDDREVGQAAVHTVPAQVDHTGGVAIGALPSGLSSPTGRPSPCDSPAGTGIPAGGAANTLRGAPLIPKAEGLPGGEGGATTETLPSQAREMGDDPPSINREMGHPSLDKNFGNLPHAGDPLQVGQGWGHHDQTCAPLACTGRLHEGEGRGTAMPTAQGHHDETCALGNPYAPPSGSGPPVPLTRNEWMRKELGHLWRGTIYQEQYLHFFDEYVREDGDFVGFFDRMSKAASDNYLSTYEDYLLQYTDHSGCADGSCETQQADHSAEDMEVDLVGCAGPTAADRQAELAGILKRFGDGIESIMANAVCKVRYNETSYPSLSGERPAKRGKKKQQR